MADLSGYKDKMDYCETHANNGTLTTDNGYYKFLKEKSRNLPELASWLTRNVDTKVKHV